jgi:hypothetical protein
MKKKMKEKINEEWNPNEWQGRSKYQVNRNNTVMSYGITIGIVTFLICLVYSLFGCKSSKNVDCDAYSKTEVNK